MRLHQLDLSDFRNIKEAHLSLSPRCTVFHGANGQGKTNLLEAAFFLFTHSSFRAVRSAELVRLGSPGASLSAQIELEGLRSTLELRLRPPKRSLTLDGKALRSLGALPWPIGAVAFTPDDLQVPKASPGARRRLLDRAIATTWTAHNALCRDYQRVLGNRNVILKSGERANGALLEVYDGQLARIGGKLALTRHRYLQALEPRFQRIFSELMGPALDPALRYERVGLNAPTVEASLEGFIASLAAAIRAARPLDVRRGVSTVGPHTDDLSFLLLGQPAKSFASQGQTRALVLAFKLAQIVEVHERWKHYPLLLLDDVSSELDAERNAFLHSFLSALDCQLLISTARPELVTITENRKDFRVISGMFLES